MNAVQGNVTVTELVNERHKYYHQSEMCYDKLEQCNTSVNEIRQRLLSGRESMIGARGPEV